MHLCGISSTEFPAVKPGASVAAQSSDGVSVKSGVRSVVSLVAQL